MNFRRVSFLNWTKHFHYDFDGRILMIPMSAKNKNANNLIASPRTHIMSVDVEDYFILEAFANSVPQETWESWPSRVVKNTTSVLDLFTYDSSTYPIHQDLYGMPGTQQPRIRDKWKSRVRHYTNLHKMGHRLEILLENYSFQPFSKLVESHVAAEEPPVLEAARAHHE